MGQLNKKDNQKISYGQYILSIIITLIIGIVGTSVYKDYTADSLTSDGIESIDPKSDLAPIEEIYQLLLTRYVDPLEKQRLIEGALAGMAAGTGDPYTEYLNEQIADSLNDDISGSFQGIGTEVTIEGQYLKVIAPLNQSPAEKAGIQANDYILAVDGTNIAGMSLTEAVELIRGEEGTIVTLTILRGEQQFEVDITRAKIPLETVYVELDAEYSNIAHVKVTKFSEPTAKDLTKALQELDKKGVDSIVLDVRSNPGGVLVGALEVANIFIPNGEPIMQSEERSQKKPTIYYADKEFGTYKYQGNVVLLVDEGSASASEILAGALQSINVPIIGQTTFGKGTIQTIQPLSLSDGALKITMGRWLTATGEPINKKGITPDKKVQLDLPEAMFSISSEKTYQFEDIGPEVENIKKILNYLGYEVNLTNIYDEATVESVRGFQKSHQISENGIIDTETANALSSAVRDQMIKNDKQYKTAIKELIQLQNNS